MWLVPKPWALYVCVRDPRDVLSATAADSDRAHARGTPATATPARAPIPTVRYMVRDRVTLKPINFEDPEDVCR